MLKNQNIPIWTDFGIKNEISNYDEIPIGDHLWLNDHNVITLT